MIESDTIKEQKTPAQTAYEYLKNMLDNVADPIFVKDRNHYWIDGNKAFWELMGGPPEKFIGKTDYDFFPEAEADVFWEKDNEVFATKKTVVNEEFLTDRNGIQHIISTKKALFFNENGEQVLVGIIRDITAEKELEALKSEMARNALEQQWRFYDTALSNTADFNYLFDLEGRFIYMNKALLDLWGKSFSEAVGKNFFELGYPTELAARLQAQIQKVIETKGTIKDETPYTAFDTRIYEYIFKPVLRNDDSVEAVAGSTRDITDLKEADRRKDEFLAMLAHELRNPLAPISNAAHILKSTSVTDAMRHEAASLVERQVSQMTHLLNDLLDVSRVTLGKIDLRLERVTLADILNRAIENARPHIDERQHVLHLDLPAHDVRLKADAVRLTQVFSNLLHNAAKYTEKNGHITVRAVEAEGSVTVDIKDTGIGMSAEILPHIFDLFAQADSSMERAQGGLGIGLTLAKTLVEKHKGGIRAQSPGKGKGSEFTVILPTETSQDQETSVPPSLQKDGGSSYRILIIDDNIASAKTLGWMLEIQGHNVKLAHEGREALEAAKDFLPHIVLLDIGLPGQNGYEVCKALKVIPGLERTALIAQTGWGQKEHLQRSREAGFIHHLVKPIRMETLQAILSELNL